MSKFGYASQGLELASSPLKPQWRLQCTMAKETVGSHVGSHVGSNKSNQCTYPSGDEDHATSPCRQKGKHPSDLRAFQGPPSKPISDSSRVFSSGLFQLTPLPHQSMTALNALRTHLSYCSIGRPRSTTPAHAAQRAARFFPSQSGPGLFNCGTQR